MRVAREILTGLLLVLMLAGCGGGGGGGGGDSVDPPSSVATLADLALSAGDLDQAFQSDQFVYTATVGFLTTATTVTPTTTDAAATVTVNGVDVGSGSASAPISLAVGENTLTVIVTAEDGVTTGTYTVTVTRESPSTVATLADLALSAGDLDQAFQSDQYDYTATVGFLTTATTVTPTTTDAAATVSVNGVDVVSGSASAPIPLVVGENTLTVIVTAEDGVSTGTYTVTVTRESHVQCRHPCRSRPLGGHSGPGVSVHPVRLYRNGEFSHDRNDSHADDIGCRRHGECERSGLSHRAAPAHQSRWSSGRTPSRSLSPRQTGCPPAPIPLP